jgi:hypothetical protein
MVSQHTFILFTPLISECKLKQEPSLLFKNENYIGHISYYLDDNNVSVGFLNVNENYQGNGFGKLLMHIMFLDLINQKIEINEISLDDCSDEALSKKSIYFKLGFRITNSLNPEVMKLFINDKEIIDNPYIYIKAILYHLKYQKFQIYKHY